MVTRIDTDKNHYRMAFERFSKYGPIALLPIGDTSFSVAWTLPKEQAEAYMGFSDAELLLNLQKQFFKTLCNKIRKYMQLFSKSNFKQ